MGIFGKLLGNYAKSVILGQIRAFLPYIGGFVSALGVQNQVNPQSLEGAVYYIISSLFVLVPAYSSYIQKKNVQSLVTAAAAAVPGSPEAAAIVQKVS